MSQQIAVKLRISGMHCDACVRRVTAALAKLPGVGIDHVSVGEAHLGYDPAQSDLHVITAALKAVGFEAEA